MLLTRKWNAEMPCPYCNGEVTWTMSDTEHSEVRRTLEAAGCGMHWATDVICGHCEVRLIVDLTLEKAGIDMELHVFRIQGGT